MLRWQQSKAFALYVVGCMVDLTSFYQESNGSFSHAELIGHDQVAVAVRVRGIL
jgi:hypothetical protein